jgi:hypothetical protein
LNNCIIIQNNLTAIFCFEIENIFSSDWNLDKSIENHGNIIWRKVIFSTRFAPLKVNVTIFDIVFLTVKEFIIEIFYRETLSSHIFFVALNALTVAL